MYIDNIMQIKLHQLCIFFVAILTISNIAISIENQSELIQENKNNQNESPSFADLSYYPNFHNFSDQYQDIIANTTFEIWNSGCCGLTYSIIEEAEWIEVEPIYGHSYGEKDIITVTINTTNLPFGVHSYEILIDTNVGSGIFLVRVTIIEPPNNPPNKPILTGPNSGTSGETLNFIASSTDPDEDQIWYKWDWGDGNISDWIGPYESGEKCTQQYTWNEQGTYQIQVKARDTREDETEWSDPIVIELPKNKIHIDQFYEWIQWLINLFFNI